MRKIIAVFMLAILLVGCGNSGKVKETDSVLTAPEIKSQETNNTIATVRDYGSKTVVDGFWVQENPDGAGKKFYRYIPLLEKKLPGIYDVEDSEEHKSYDAFRSYNRPKGTVSAGINSSSESSAFYSIPKLGFNSDPKDEVSQVLELVSFTNSFSLLQDDNKKNSLMKYDVGCLTFALYKELYNGFPDMRVQIYGITENELNKNLGDISSWDFKKYSAFTNQCKKNDFNNCDFLGEKSVSESGIYYLDYNELSKRGNYKQYFIVLRFSESVECGYYMNGMSTYIINDASEYETWKQMHKAQFIGE